MDRIKSWLVDVVSALAAYVLARWIFSGGAGVFEKLHWELLAFGGFYGLFQLLIRGRKIAAKGRD